MLRDRPAWRTRWEQSTAPPGVLLELAAEGLAAQALQGLSGRRGAARVAVVLFPTVALRSVELQPESSLKFRLLQVSSAGRPELEIQLKAAWTPKAVPQSVLAGSLRWRALLQRVLFGSLQPPVSPVSRLVGRVLELLRQRAALNLALDRLLMWVGRGV